MSTRANLVVSSLILVLFLAPFSVPAEGLENVEFCTVVGSFVSAWTAKDLGTLDSLIDPDFGFWVIRKLGVERLASRFRSIEEPLGMEEYGFAFLGTVDFEGCNPKKGPAPACSGIGEMQPLCRFGETDPEFIRVLEVNLDEAAQGSEERIRLQQGFRKVKLAAEEGAYFVSDQSWGAAFYFVRMGGQWRLLAVDMSDCSA